MEERVIEEASDIPKGERTLNLHGRTGFPQRGGHSIVTGRRMDRMYAGAERFAHMLAGDCGGVHG